MNEQFFTSLNGYKVKDEYAVHTYDTVSDMKADTKLKEGMHVKTKGYYSANDGGCGEYFIKSSSTTHHETLNNELVAELIIENNVINIRQLGARSQDTENNKYDIKQYIDKYIELIDNIPNRCRLYIPSGIWYCSPCDITNANGFDIYGDYGYSEYRFNSTIITTMQDNQTHLLNLGSNEGDYLKNYHLENIILSTYDYAWDSTDKAWKPSTNKKVINQVVNMLYAIHGKLDNIFFVYCIGQCLKISACWENIFSYLAFRFVSNPTGSIMCFGKDTTYGTSTSVSSSDFQKMYFEKCHGDLIEVNSGANVANNHFGIINLEPNQFDYDNTFTYTTLDNTNLPVGLKHYYILKLNENGSNMIGNKIESIELNGMAQKIISFSDNDYVYDSILFTGDGYQYFNNVIGSIVSTSTKKDLVLFKNTKSNTQFVSGDSALDIQSVLIDSKYNYVFDLDSAFPSIHVGGDLVGFGSLTKITSNITSFQECLQSLENSASNNCITSDSGALNKTKLCFRPWSYLAVTMGGTIVTGSKIYVHAKLDDEETYSLQLRNEDESHGQQLSFTGDGTWKWYEFELNENMNVLGQKCWFKSSNANNKNVLFDCFMFKD